MNKTQSATPSDLFSKVREQNQDFHQLSLLLLGSDELAAREHAMELLLGRDRDGLARLLATADTHHVVVRAFQLLQRRATNVGEQELAQWAATAVSTEQERAQKAVIFLRSICEALSSTGCPVLVIKSLEHWPDLGSDLDLFTTADDRGVVRIMTKQLHAQVLDRSWGDRLAHKWNFKVPGLAEAIEVHVARLGQTGEHVGLARRLVEGSLTRAVHGYDFRVPAAEGSIILCTLQRMYRHFYLRLCDIVDAANLVENRPMDYGRLRTIAEPAGIWPGVATFLKIVSDYLEAYRGQGLNLPAEVLSAAMFGGKALFCRGNFLRIPILRQGAKLYTMQVTNAAFRGDVPAVLRLSLLPYLGAAAAIEYKLTGSDKGVW